MSEAQAARPPQRGNGPNWTRRAIIAIVAALLVVVIVAVSYAALPRWWAQRAGDQVDGSLSTGVVIGFMYGFLCTLLPVFVLAFVYRFFRRRLLAWVIGGTFALLLAAPNLITLWIVVGTGNAVHAADRTLDVEAPWFRGGMLIGAAVAVAFIVYVVVVRRRGRREPERAEPKQKAAAPPGSPSG